MMMIVDKQLMMIIWWPLTSIL